ncbi:MAG TPA: GNAT family N-acetyltransferase [Oculatellaceae cyanobacterium]
MNTTVQTTKAATRETQEMAYTIREAVEADVPVILQLIRELAEYEKLLHEVEATEERLAQSLFAFNATAKALMVDVDGRSVGFALYFYNYSTFLAKKGIYLEDLYVQPAYRGKGLGKALLTKLAQIAVKEDCGRLEWSVLDWNAPSIAFYKSLEAVPMDEWTTYRLTGEALSRLGRQ